VLGLLGALACGCSPPSFPVLPPVPRSDRDALARSRAEEEFVRGLDYERRGLPSVALKLYERAYGLDPRAEDLRQLVVEKYLEQGKTAQALAILREGGSEESLSQRELSLLGMIYLRMGDFNRAAAAFERLKEMEPEQMYALGMLYESMGKPQLAIQTYLRFLRQKPDAAPVAFKAANLLLQQNRPAEAESLLASQEVQSGRSAELVNLLGVARLVAGDTAAALTLFGEALTVDSTAQDALQNLGRVHVQRKDYGLAVRVYERLARSSSWNPQFSRTLALLYYYSDQYDSAAALLQRLLESDMDDWELHYFLGLVSSEQHKSDVARLELQKAIELNPQFEDAWERLCMLSAREREWDLALGDARNFTEALAARPAAWRTLGYVYSARKEWASSATALQRALSLDSSDTLAWFELGSACERRGLVDSAASAFRRVLALKPRDPVASNYLGYMWTDKGIRLDSAATLIRNALAQDTGNGAYLDSYAWVLYRTGSLDSAYIYMRRAAAKVTDDAVVFEHLGDIQLKRGNRAQACDAYRKSLSLKPEKPDLIEQKVNDACGRKP
jgi:tetratricopeptide (TPR) repeat protein